jgi:hypothetical protein
MVRLLEASITLHNWAVALNVFALWVVSAGMAGLVFVFVSRRPDPSLTDASRRSLLVGLAGHP